MDPDRSVADDVESNAPALAQGTAQEESRHETHGQDEAREAFLRMMSDWYTEYVRVNPNVPPPPPPPIPQPVPVAPRSAELVRSSKPPVDRIRKHGAEDFRANVDDDPEKAEFWLENTIRVFDELSCTPEECLKCAVSLLKDSAYRWWKTLISVVPKERVTWDFFQEEFRKKYVSQRFIDQKRKEFLGLKQGRMSVAEYEREFVRLSKYAQECVPTEAIMCKIFEEGLNEDIRLYVGVLELKEFVVLVDRAYKAEELSREKRRAEMEARDVRKRSMGRTFQSHPKKFKGMDPRTTGSVGYARRDRGRSYSGATTRATSVASVGNVGNTKPECQQCGRRHTGECWGFKRACFKCGSQEHYVKDFPERIEEEKLQRAGSGDIVSRGRPPRNVGSKASGKSVIKDAAGGSETRAPARTYAIRAREDASSPDVITGTFSLHDIDVIALIDPGSTHSYVCMNLVSSKKLPVENTEFVVKVSNHLGKYVLVDKVCKNCPLMIQGHCFLANLMLLPFDEFDVILGMDWLILHDAKVNCRQKILELKCENGQILRVEAEEPNKLPIVIPHMSA